VRVRRQDLAGGEPDEPGVRLRALGERDGDDAGGVVRARMSAFKKFCRFA